MPVLYRGRKEPKGESRPCVVYIIKVEVANGLLVGYTGFRISEEKRDRFPPERLYMILGQPDLLFHGYSFGFKATRALI